MIPSNGITPNEKAETDDLHTKQIIFMNNVAQYSQIDSAPYTVI